MGCGSSKPAAGHGSTSRRYLDFAGGDLGGEDAYLPSTGPLTAKEYKERLTTSEGTQSVDLPNSRYSIRYAFVSQRGYYPDSPDKPNQDAFCVHTYFGGDAEQHFFGVFDGHGEFGTPAAQFARDRVPSNLLASGHFGGNPSLAMHNSMVTTNIQCHQADFDDSMSGTTAICLLVRGRSVLVANVGDSRAVLAEKSGGGGFIARDLSLDQTPYRADECKRVKACGARVQTLDQVEGLKDPSIECWTTEQEDDGDPPRLWFPNQMYPGTAFTRSIGDAAAERIGVFAEPEIEALGLMANDAFLVIASDGVFEFLSSQSVVDMVSKFDDLHDAALSVVAESYRLWLQYETRTDDITMIILQFSGLETPPLGGGAGPGGAQQHQNMPAHMPVLSELGLQPAARATHNHEPPPPPVRLSDIDCSLLAAQAAAEGGGGGSGSALPRRDSLGEGSNARLVDLLAPARSAESPAASLRGQAGADLMRGISSVGTVISNEKGAAVMRMLEESVRNNFLFAHLSGASRAAVFAEMERMEVQPGEVIIRQGDRGDHFFIVQSGEYDVLVAPPLADAITEATYETDAPPAGAAMGWGLPAPPPPGAAPPAAGVGEEDEWRVIDQGELVHTYRAPLEVGEGAHPSFGELALLYGKPRAATVVAVTDGVLWRISRECFRSALQAAETRDSMARVVRALRSMELLAPLTIPQLQRLAEALCIEHHRDGEFICRQGGTWDAFHIVAKGTVVATTQRKGGSPSEAREVLSMGPGQYFGERHLLGASVRPASMIARGEVTVLTMARATFEGMFGPLQELLDRHAAWKAWSDAQRDVIAATSLLGPKPERVLAGKLDTRRLQPRGALWATPGYTALVELTEAGGAAGARRREGNGRGDALSLTGRLMSVADVEARNLGPAVTRSRAITRDLPPNLFVPHAAGTWRGEGKPAAAGEVLATMGVCTLKALLAGGPLDDYSAAYAAACAVLGLEHLHNLGVVYRGLSAQTMLVTEAGVIQLVDFRFAKRNEGRTFTLCGPPQYLAPETVEGTGHTEAVDFWALGVLIFHLLTGQKPFAAPGDDELRVYKRITRAAPTMPALLSAEAKDIVGQLLVRDPDARLGVAPGGVARLMAHPFFKPIDWAQLREGRCTMPLVLRDRLFNIAGGELITWHPLPVAGKQQPAWLQEF